MGSEIEVRSGSLQVLQGRAMETEVAPSCWLSLWVLPGPAGQGQERQGRERPRPLGGGHPPSPNLA